ncbi:hypothetical protein MRX96_053930 [Rhipicephalus microplus]
MLASLTRLSSGAVHFVFGTSHGERRTAGGLRSAGLAKVASWATAAATPDAGRTTGQLASPFGGKTTSDHPARAEVAQAENEPATRTKPPVLPLSLEDQRFATRLLTFAAILQIVSEKPCL